MIVTYGAAVQVVDTVVIFRKFIGLAVDFELGAADTVRVTADKGTETATVVLITAYIVISESNILDLTVAVRHINTDDQCAVVTEGNLHAVLVLDGVKSGLLSLLGLSEALLHNTHNETPFSGCAGL